MAFRMHCATNAQLEQRPRQLACPRYSSLASRQSRLAKLSIQATLADDVPRTSLTRKDLAASFNYSFKQQKVPRAPETDNPIVDFVSKLKLAWNIFFPEKQAAVSPKEAGKQRLRMILVADRCGMSPSSLSEMKRTIVKALSDFVDIEHDADIEVSISTEPQLGTIYCVAIPISRVKPGAKLPTELTGDGDGVTMEWDPENFDSDPSGRFPMGTTGEALAQQATKHPQQGWLKLDIDRQVTCLEV